MQYPDYYARLGLSKDASADDIKKAYRKLARKYHPDVSKEPDAAKQMAEINEAHLVLSDPEKRKVYDQVGHQAWAQGARSAEDMRPPPGWNQGFGQHGQSAGHAFGQDFGEDYSDFFEELFGSRARQRSRHSASSSRREALRGEDQYATIELSLAEAYSGGERTLQLETINVDAQGQMQPETRTLSVKIPAGVSEGQLIRLAGQGHPGFGGGAAGDLLLKVHIRPTDHYHVTGRDVHMRVPVAPWEAALGTHIAVQTPAGTLSVTVPAGSGAGKKLRLRGKGIPGKPAGDLLMELEIAVPGAVTDAQKAAWQALADVYPQFNPRPA